MWVIAPKIERAMVKVDHLRFTVPYVTQNVPYVTAYLYTRLIFLKNYFGSR